MMHITPQTLKLFTSLPPFEATFSAVPAVKEHLVAKGVQDLLAGTAMLFVQYGHWYTSGSDTILVSELVNVSNMMMANPKFLHQFGDPLGAPANG
ncbi:hypothetical protein [Ferrimonas sediminum]|nr:hypothetical protein [Ferrimonas sediminum]